MSSPIVSFSCGLQQTEVMYQGRSLWTPESEWENGTVESNNSLTSWEPKLNLTEAEEETTKGAGNETAPRGQEEAEEGRSEGMTPRIVGGLLEKAGGSPWQVKCEAARHRDQRLKREREAADVSVEAVFVSRFLSEGLMVTASVEGLWFPTAGWSLLLTASRSLQITSP